MLIKRISIILVVQLLAFMLPAQERIFIFSDSLEQIESREISQESLDIYTSKKAYNYAEKSNRKGSFQMAWSRFISKLLSTIERRFSLKFLWYALMIAAVVAIVWFLLKTPSSSFIASNNTSIGAYVKELDIREDERTLFQKLQESEETQSFKQAIRYAYLINLKALDESDKIHWKEYKLSNDYLAELQDMELKKDFRQMTKFFNYAWYGNRKINASKYQSIKQTFERLNERIKKTK